MTLPPLGAARGREIAARASGVHVLVVGDVMLDRFLVGRVTRISPEAPVPVVRFQHEHVRLGGAANVALNLAALGARGSLVGIVGADAAAGQLRAVMTGAGLGVAGLVEDRSRRTVEKVRVVTDRNQQVARIDYEEDADAGPAVERELIDRLTSAVADAAAVVVSDYLKGSVTSRIMRALVSLKAPGTPLIVDPKIPHLDAYAGATVVTPNQLEAETATHRRIRTDEDVRAAAREFRDRAQCGSVLVTRGEHGMWLSSPEAEGSLPAAAREVADVTGAGDTVVATLALALAAGATLSEAAALANHAAALVVGKFGPATVTADELIRAIEHDVQR
jgi:D-beta-D-heptose 7-phosphate kinase/D-beta-D-heptose 1-phosphate adenosyltransferase